MTAEELAKLTKGARRRADGRWWDARCPAHEDKRASLSFRDGDRGGDLVLKCHVGCTREQIAAALGVELGALLGGNGHGGGGAVICEPSYDYRDERGDVLYQVVRLEPKSFRQRRPNGRGGWTWGVSGVRRVVYRLDELAEATRVHHVEGEKDADRLVALGWRATTTPGGADQWRDNYADQVKAAGVTEVVILPDNDPAGERYAAQAARSYLRRMLRVKIVRLPGLPEKGDVSDYFDAGHTIAELAAEIDATSWLEEAPADPAATESTPGPRATFEGEAGVFEWGDAGVEIRIAGARESRESSGELHAECAVRLRGADVHWARLNLASTPARETLVRKLTAIAPEIPWREHLEHACRGMANHVREGTPLVVLCPAPRVAQADLIDGVLPLGETSVLYADGGAGKGYIALLCALAVESGHPLPHLRPLRCGVRTLYLDWESTQSEIETRIEGLCRGSGLPLPTTLLYRAMSRALADEAPRLRADIARHGVELVIVDSLAPACGAEPESADAAIRALNALRSLTGTTRLVQAHVSKVAADQPSGPARPYGSVFVRNLARSAWELRRSEESEPDELVIAAYHRKHNAGRLASPFGLRLHFQPDGAVRVTGTDLADSPDLLARASLSKRITVTLAGGAMTIPALAEHLSASKETVRRTVDRLRDKRHVVQVGDTRPSQWGLPTS